MGRKKQSEYDPDFWDPIAIENRVRAREAYLNGLFFDVLDPHYLAKEIKWLVQGLIPQNYLCMLVAEPKEGKTCLATALALAVATGTPFAGRETRQGAVLWLAAEENHSERQLLLRNSPVVDTTLPLYTCYEHLPIDQEDSLDALRHWINRTGARLLVVDPLQAAITGRSLSGGYNARRSLQPIKQLCNDCQVAVLVLHHQKHTRYGLSKRRAAENDQLTATASLIMSMNVRKLEPSPFPAAGDSPSPCLQGEGQGVRVCEDATIHQRRLINLEFTGRGEFANQTVWLLSHSPLDYAVINRPEAATPMPDDYLTALEEQVLIAIGPEAKTSNMILDRLVHFEVGSARNCLTRLRRKGHVVVDVKEDRSRWYRLTAAGLIKWNALQKQNEQDEPDELLSVDSKTGL